MLLSPGEFALFVGPMIGNRVVCTRYNPQSKEEKVEHDGRLESYRTYRQNTEYMEGGQERFEITVEVDDGPVIRASWSWSSDMVIAVTETLETVSICTQLPFSTTETTTYTFHKH